VGTVCCGRGSCIAARLNCRMRSDFIAGATFGDCLQRWADSQPDALALIHLDDGELENERWTYATLDREAQAVAAELQTHAIEGQPVLLVLPPGLGFVAALCGCLYAGVVAVPVPFPTSRRGAARLASITANAQPAAVLTTAASAGRVTELVPPSLRTVPLITVDQLDRRRRFERASVASEAPAIVQYTSGSTSEPKGIVITHAALTANLEMMRKAGQVDRDSVYVSWLPLFHDMGLIGVVLEALYAGALAVVMPAMAFLQRPNRWLQAIDRYRATISGAPNFAYDLCVRRFRPDTGPRFDLSSWRMAFCGAEPIRAETLRRFAHVFSPYGFRESALYPTYGLAEATVFVSGGELGAGLRTLPAGGGNELVSCGHAWHDGRIAIVDPDTMRERSEGHAGEIWISGSHLAAGYWNNAVATRERFGARLSDRPEHLYLRTGDIGLMSGADLYVLGRSNEQLIVNGETLHPQDIEHAIACSHASFGPVGAAFSIDTERGEQIVAVHEVTLTAMSELDHSAAMAAAFTAVGSEVGVRLFDLVPVRPGAIPLTTSGKVRRGECKELYCSGALASLRMQGDHRWLGKYRP
jgi:acyl-CoA synthetase (AMP-forming)/AMP-acid ligase II